MDRRRAETAPRRPAAFHCGWLLDGGGAGPRRDVVLTVAGGRIDAIFPAAEGCQGLKPVDWRAFTVLPPLVDAHVHLFLPGCDSIEHGFFMGEANMERMAARGTVWVPTAGTMAGCLDVLAAGSPEADGARRLLDHQVGQLARARELGVTVAAGTDAGSPGVRHGRAMAVELGLMSAAGYSLGETVRCAAVHGARLLGLSRSGVLQPGAWADFIAVAGPPEALWGSLEQVQAVYCKGLAVDLS